MPRQPDVDDRALAAVIRRALGNHPGVRWARTAEGVSALVYRIERDDEVFFLRLAEEADEDLEVDAGLLGRLAEIGVHVPRIVHVEHFADEVGRSVMVMTDIGGESLARRLDAGVAAEVARRAGRDLALLNTITVEGFGWIRRDRPRWPPAAEIPAYRDFVTSQMESVWPSQLEQLFTTAEVDAIGAVIEAEASRRLEHAQLAHGDFDVTPIFHRDGQYTGLIDFGEIRGTEPMFDLGHFLLHDRGTNPQPLLDDVVAGYREVADLPDDWAAAVRRSGVLLGLRQLCLWIGRRGMPLDHFRARGRAVRIAALLDR